MTELARQRVGSDEKKVATAKAKISKQIASLARAFGVALISDSGRGSPLTDEGRELAARAAACFQSFKQFGSACYDQIRIGGGDRLLQWLLLPRLENIRSDLLRLCAAGFENPRFILENYPMEDVLKGLRECSLDLALVSEKTALEMLAGLYGHATTIQSERVHELEYSLFVSKRLLTESQSQDGRWIMKNLAFADASKFTERICRAAAESGTPLSVKARVECENFPQACVAVKLGAYAAVVPSLADRELPATDFWKLPIPFLGEWKRPVRLLWNTQHEDIRGEAAKHLRTVFLKNLHAG